MINGYLANDGNKVTSISFRSNYLYHFYLYKIFNYSDNVHYEKFTFIYDGRNIYYWFLR